MDEGNVTGPTGASFDHNVDRYPSLEQVFSTVLGRIDHPEAPIERVEVTTLADGSATYRVYPARAEEPETGYLESVDAD